MSDRPRCDTNCMSDRPRSDTTCMSDRPLCVRFVHHMLHTMSVFRPHSSHDCDPASFRACACQVTEQLASVRNGIWVTCWCPKSDMTSPSVSEIEKWFACWCPKSNMTPLSVSEMQMVFVSVSENRTHALLACPKIGHATVLKTVLLIPFGVCNTVRNY